MIRPEIFERAAKFIENGPEYYTCRALTRVRANKKENKLWEDCHSINSSSDFGWFGDSIIEENQTLRETLLREIALNLREQGYE